MNDADGVEVTAENIEVLREWKDDSTGTKWRLVKRDGSVCAEEQDGTGHWWRAGDAQTSVVAKELARVLAEWRAQVLAEREGAVVVEAEITETTL